MDLPINHGAFVQSYQTPAEQLNQLQQHTEAVEANLNDSIGNLQAIQVASAASHLTIAELVAHRTTINNNFTALQGAVQNPAAFETLRQTAIGGLNQAHQAAQAAMNHLHPPVHAVAAHPVVQVHAEPVQGHIFNLGDVAFALPLDNMSSSENSLNVHTGETDSDHEIQGIQQ